MDESEEINPRDRKKRKQQAGGDDVSTEIVSLNLQPFDVLIPHGS